MSAMGRMRMLVATHPAKTEIIADVTLASDERVLAMGADRIGPFWLYWRGPGLKHWARFCARFFAHAQEIAPWD